MEGDTFAAQLTSFARHAGAVQGVALLVAACVVAFLFALRSRWPHLPGPLAAVLLATAVAVVFGLRRHGVALVGNIPAGLSAVKAPALQARDFRELALPAVSVVVVAFSDVVLTGRSFARRRESIDANQEFLALGVANVGASFVHGFPVSSSASRTAIARSRGARTQVYSVATLATVLLVLLAGRPVLARFPQPALGAIVIYAATQLINISAFRRLAAFRRREFALALAAAAGVLAAGILYGVLLAVGLSAAELLIRVGRPHDAILGVVPGLAGMHDVDDYPRAQTVPGLVVYRYDAPLFFANARVKQDLLTSLRAFGLTGKIGKARIFQTLPTAVAAYQDWARKHPPDGPIAERP